MEMLPIPYGGITAMFINALHFLTYWRKNPKIISLAMEEQIQHGARWGPLLNLKQVPFFFELWAKLTNPRSNNCSFPCLKGVPDFPEQLHLLRIQQLLRERTGKGAHAFL